MSLLQHGYTARGRRCMLARGIFAFCVILGPATTSLAAPAESRREFVQTRDGVRLDTRIYLPNGTGPFPTIVVRTAYDLPTSPPGGLGRELDDDAPDKKVIAQWEPAFERGYAVVMQNTRGRAKSGGVDRLLLTDARDGADLIEWVARQPWSDKAVVVAGDSADGFAAYLAAAARPPALKAGFAQVSCGQVFSKGVVQSRGAVQWEAVLPYMLNQTDDLSRTHLAALKLDRRSITAAREEVESQLGALFSGDPDTASDILNAAPLDDFEGLETLYPAWRGVFTPESQNRRAAKLDAARSIEVPFLHVGLWQDIFADCTLSMYRSLQKRLKNQALWMLNGSHYDIDDPDIWPRTPMLDWFDQQLKRAPSAAKPVGNLVQIQNARGRTATTWTGATWPPASVETHILYLTARGELTARRSTKGATLGVVLADPSDPVPTVGGRNLVIEAGALDQNVPALKQRGDILRFVSGPLDAPMTVAGKVTLDIAIASNQPDTDVAAKLVDIGPDGTQTIVADTLLRARYRDGRGKVRSLQPGRYEPMTLVVGEVGHRFGAGHRLGLHIAGSNFPRFDVNPNNGGPLYRSQEGRIARNRIGSLPTHPAALRLPIMQP